MLTMKSLLETMRHNSAFGVGKHHFGDSSRPKRTAQPARDPSTETEEPFLVWDDELCTYVRKDT